MDAMKISTSPSISAPGVLLNNLGERHINPQRICIEITETAAFKDTRRALAHMTSLKQEGIRFALDDFGTGYASIELLRKLPFTFVKIDRTIFKIFTTIQASS